MSLRRGRKRFWWQRCLEQMNPRALRPCDWEPLRQALIAGEYEAILLLHTAMLTNAAADDLLLDLVLCLNHDTEELARALVAAFPGLKKRVAQLVNDC